MKTWFYPLLTMALSTLIIFAAMQSYGVDTTTEGRSKVVNSSAEKATAPPNSNKKPLPMVSVETVKSGPLSKIIELTGSVTPTRTARIASSSEGPVIVCAQRCMVREGDTVKKNQVLILIGRNKTAQAQLAAAKQALQEKKSELQRIKTLVKAGAIPGAQLDSTRSAYENARAQLARASESKDDYSITAPWEGIVAKVYVTEGDYVSPRSVLVEIFDPASLVIQFAVPESRSVEVQNGMAVRVRLDAYPGKTFPGIISRVYPQLDLKMRTRTVEATLIDDIDLLPGMFARIEVLLAEIPDALTVPTEAVLVNPEGEQVAFVLQGNKVIQHKVQTGVEDEGRVQIIAGVKPGDQVVVAGNEKLKDGAKVRTDARKQL